MRPQRHAWAALVVAMCLLPAPTWAQDGAFWSAPAADVGDGDVDRLLFRAMAASNGGKNTDFGKTVAELMRVAPEHPGTQYYRAVQLSRAGRVAEARTLLESVLALRDGVPGVPAEYLHYDHALMLAQLGELLDARRAWRLALQHGRTGLHEAVYLSGAAEISMAVGELDAAVSDYRLALERDPAYPHALFGMAMALERQGKHDVARGYLLEGLLVDPGGKRFLAASTVFVPSEDRAFAEGLIAEELGNTASALAHLESFCTAAKRSGHKQLGAGTEALARVRTNGPAVVGTGRLPIPKVTATAVDPRGRFVALGNARGQLVLVNLAKSKIVAAPSLSGPAVIAMAFSGDTLLVADDFGDVTPFSTKGAVKRGAPRGPVALAGGTRVLGLSPEGAALVVSDPRGRALRVADTKELKGIPGSMKVSVGNPAVVAVGPWSAKRGALFTAIWSTSRTLELVHGPSGTNNRVIQVPSPGGSKHSSSNWDAVTISHDGRRIILVGRRYLAVCRTADGRIVRLLDIGVDSKLGAVTAAMFDPKGAAGHGPAVLALHEQGYRAIRLDLFE